MSRRRWMATGAASVALALALGGVSLAKASTAKGDKSDRAKYASLYRDRLAKRLGVDAAALDSARKAAAEDVIAQALKDGAITPTQAAHMRTRLAEGLDDGFHFFKPGRGDKMAKNRVFRAAFDAVLAKLGMTQAQFKDAIRSGKTLEQIAAEHKTTVAALGTAAAHAAKPGLDELVKNGTITQNRENEILAKLKSGKFPMFGHHRGFNQAA